MKEKKDIAIWVENGLKEEGFRLKNVDEEDIVALYKILKPYGVKVGIKKEG